VVLLAQHIQIASPFVAERAVMLVVDIQPRSALTPPEYQPPILAAITGACQFVGAYRVPFGGLHVTLIIG